MSDGGRGWDLRWGSIALVSVLLAVGGSSLVVRWIVPDCRGQGCPSVERIGEYRPDEPPQVFDADGDLAGTLSGPRRTVVPLDSIPGLVREGYVAVEDRRFREHGGVDLVGGLRALVANLRSGEVEEGASTLTMQLARSVFGSELLEWNRWRRKLAEIRLARRIEDRLTKDRILELYLNQIYLGDGVYGVGTAARHYLGKSVSGVTPREAAFLVGLARNPEGYDPDDHPEAARERIATVLDVLERQGVIDEETAEDARGAELGLREEGASRGWGTNAYYLAAVQREVRRLVPEPERRAGVHVHTGLDQGAQAAAVDALGDRIRAVEAGRFGPFTGRVAPDSLPRAAGPSPYLQGMVVAMESASGLLTTLVGGRDHEHSEFDRALQARRQPGSAFKPVLYAAALGKGTRLHESISTDPVRFARRGGPDWEPADHVGGGKITVRDALVMSSNTAAARVGRRTGIREVRRQARAMGIESEIPSYPSVFLGAAEIVPVELVAAYATLENGGHTVDPHLVTRIEAPDGRVLYRRRSDRGRRALDSRIAFLVVDVMRDVVTRGTGWRIGASGLGVPVAGKTGTTDGSRDLWFIGMTPGRVAGVWIGFDEPRTVVEGAGGGEIAAPVWADFMRSAAGESRGAEPWAVPPGIVEATIDAEGRYAVPDDCPLRPDETRTEYFLRGTEPMEWCPYRPMMDEVWWDTTAPETTRRDTTGRPGPGAVR